MKTLLALATALFLVGCGASEEKTAAKSDSAKKNDDQYKTPLTGTTAGQIVEDMAGATDIKAGRKAQEKLIKIAEQEKKDFEEVMGGK